jgi:dethiobiotin synthetase
MSRLDSNSNRIFITGTDTGVGKTVLSLLLMQFFHEKGENPFYLKLIQTGCENPLDLDSDAKFIYENVPALKGKDPGASVLQCFTNPKAPWFAARDDGKQVDLQAIMRAVEEKSRSHSRLILEGAGGLFVPVDENTLMIDLITMLRAKPILAARAGLGTINHTLLSIEALRARNIDPFGIIFLDFGDVETPKDMLRENIEAVEKFSGIKVAGVIERIEDFSTPGRECFRPFLALFGDYDLPLSA